MNNFVLLQTYNSRIEAEIGKGKLDANGIKSIISADDEGGSAPYPFMPTSRGVRLLVHKKDYEKAKSLLDDSE